MRFVLRFVRMLPSAPFGMVCLFCGSLRHRARDPVNVAFINLWSRLLVYSNRLGCLLRRFGGAPSIQRPPNDLSCQYHTPLYFPSHLFLSSSLTSLHPKILLPHILRATSPPSLKKASNFNHVIERGIN